MQRRDYSIPMYAGATRRLRPANQDDARLAPTAGAVMGTAGPSAVQDQTFFRLKAEAT
jgi:hypothetical protein